MFNISYRYCFLGQGKYWISVLSKNVISVHPFILKCITIPHNAKAKAGLDFLQMY